MSAVEPIAYLNGEFVALAEARIPVTDRGFVFADSVYEVIPVYNGRPFQLKAHLRRLQRSLAEIRIADPMDELEWLGVVRRMIEINGGGDLSLYVQVTRGAALRDHGFPADAKPTVLLTASPMKPVPEAHMSAGLKAITLEDKRWGRCDIKTTALLANVLARQAALDAGADEAILTRDGYLTEASVANVFVVTSGEVLTPPLGPTILAGVTRGVVLTLLRKVGMQVREARVSQASLRQSEEIWITSSTRGVLPVTSLDGKPVGSGVPGARWQRVRALYDATIDKACGRA